MNTSHATERAGALAEASLKLGSTEGFLGSCVQSIASPLLRQKALFSLGCWPPTAFLQLLPIGCLLGLAAFLTEHAQSCLPVLAWAHPSRHRSAPLYLSLQVLDNLFPRSLPISFQKPHLMPKPAMLNRQDGGVFCPTDTLRLRDTVTAARDHTAIMAYQHLLRTCCTPGTMA